MCERLLLLRNVTVTCLCALSIDPCLVLVEVVGNRGAFVVGGFHCGVVQLG